MVLAAARAAVLRMAHLVVVGVRVLSRSIPLRLVQLRVFGIARRRWS
jgi:hypothetical protein